MTPEVEYNEQGRLQGAIYAVQMLGNLVGSYGFLRLYIATRGGCVRHARGRGRGGAAP